jgi:DNA-binding response OmpR family regulator
MTGLELLPKAKAARPDVPVIMITAYGDAETKRKALESGAEALFTKPIDFEMLRGEIEASLGEWLGGASFCPEIAKLIRALG